MPKRREIHSFVVEGRGYFPLDMLRYDCCWPSGPDDVQNIVIKTAHPHSEGYVLQTRRVRLSTWSEGRPTVGRWESFNWKVVEE